MALKQRPLCLRVKIFFMIRRRRFLSAVLVFLLIAGYSLYGEVKRQDELADGQVQEVASSSDDTRAAVALEKLDVKGRAPKTDYSREHFGGDWAEIKGCDLRNQVLKRDLTDTVVDQEDGCTVTSGVLDDPYTGEQINFMRGVGSSNKVQIDHVVALSDAWQKGAQQLSEAKRDKFANDALNLLAVDGPANMQKSDGDAATWLPPNKKYRCRYVARQIAVKIKYILWVTFAEKSAMQRVLQSCPAQQFPHVQD
jgi:hypothetical protein